MSETKVTFNPMSREKQTGKSGQSGTVRTGDRWPRRYTIRTHGKTVEEVAEQALAIEELHAERETKFEAMQAAVGREFTVGQQEFRIVDTIIRDRGTNVEVVIQITRRVGDDWVRVEGMPIRRVVRGVADLPNADGVEEIATLFAEPMVADEVAVEEFAASFTSAIESARVARAERGAL